MCFPINIFSQDDFKNKNHLKGYIYEWYCYNFVMDKYKSIKIVKAKNNIIDQNGYNYFKYDINGNVIYSIGNSIFSEFDILGISNKNVYLWEVTRGKQINIRNNIIRKINILKLTFQNHKIIVKFIIPRDINVFNKYDKIILPEPDYDNYFSKGQFVFSDKINSCISLKDFVKSTNNNSLISEILFLSNKYFTTKVFGTLEHCEGAITRLFETKNIKDEEFNSYNILTKKTEKIKYKNGNYIVNNEGLDSLSINIIEEIKKVL